MRLFSKIKTNTDYLFEERCEIVESIKYVDKVIPQTYKDMFGSWESYLYNKMFVGSQIGKAYQSEEV